MFEVPNLQAIHRAFGQDKRLVILSLNLDETIDAPRQVQEKQKLPWMQGFLGKGIDGAVPDSYGVRRSQPSSSSARTERSWPRGCATRRSRNPLLGPSRTPDPRVRVVDGSCSARAHPRPIEGPPGTGRRRRPWPDGRSLRRRG